MATSENVIKGTNGDDDLSANADGVMIYGEGGNDNISVNQYSSVSANGDAGDDTIYLVRAHYSTIQGNSGEDVLSMTNTNYSLADGGNDNDLILNSGNDYGRNILLGGAGDDTVRFSTKYMSVDGGAGNDYIISRYDATEYYSEGYNTIFGGTGNDTIMSSNDATITGGTGDDYISLQGAYNHNVVINYSEGDGNDTVEGFSFRSGSYTPTVLQIAADSYTTTTSAHEGTILTDIIIQFSDGGSITFKDVSENLIAASDFVISIVGGQNTVDDNTLSKSDGVYTYSGGNKNITNYATGEKLNWSTDLTGIDIFSDDNFVFSSSSGDLTIQNVCDKVVDFSYNGTTIAYLAKTSGALDLDASSLSQFLILVGGDYETNNFTAGSGGSWLWGGIGDYDTLTGGSGSDVFFFGKNDGFDLINNASSSDIVNLYDVSINDITSLDTSNNQITIGLNTGAKVQINPAENISAKITMSEGSVNFNHSTGQWNLA